MELPLERGLIIEDIDACSRFLARANYYRFSGYAKYFQGEPHRGNNNFRAGVTFEDIRSVYDADAELRDALVRPLAEVELLLRAHVAHVIALQHGAYTTYLSQDFYTDFAGRETTVTACLRDISRSKERYILRYLDPSETASGYSGLPVWSAVEAWCFGTLSRVIQRGGPGSLANEVATSAGIAKAGFAYRLRVLVYLRKRVAHHSRMWHHFVIDAGATPNNVRAKAKRLVGQFEPRSVLDVIASLDDMTTRSGAGEPVLPLLANKYGGDSLFWKGLSAPRTSGAACSNPSVSYLALATEPACAT